MIALDIILDGDNCWPDLRKRIGTDKYEDATSMAFAVLPEGTTSRKPVVAIRMNNEFRDFSIIGQTSLVLFIAAAKAFIAKYGDPTEG